MGKSTVSDMFRKHRCPVLDSDKVVHHLYSTGGAAVPLVEQAFPGVTVDGSINRQLLGQRVIGNQEAMQTLESIVHPLVRQEKRKFLATEKDAQLVVLDVPLLFETGYEKECDAVAVVSAPSEVQKERALAREGMTPGRYLPLLTFYY